MRKGKLRAGREHRPGHGGGQRRFYAADLPRAFSGRCVAQSVGLGIALLAGPPCGTAQSSATTEYRVKANFLAMIPSFIDWPEDAFPSAHAPVLVCVLGEFSFGINLAQAVQSVAPHGRRVEVQSKRKDQELRGCHILFVSHSEAKRYEKVLQSVQGSDVLTIGETPDFLNAGGALCFSFQRETLQFEVNLLAANNAHIKVSSRFLALARRVLNNPEAAKL